MKVILAENEEAEKFFEELMSRMTERIARRFETRFKEIEKNSKEDEQDSWVDRELAKKILGVKSKKKLQSLRDNNLIRTSRHGRLIRYYKPSLFAFLEKNVPVVK